MRPFNAAEIAEISAFEPQLDAMPDGQDKLTRHCLILLDTLRLYRLVSSSPAYECWGDARLIRRRAFQAVKTIRAYRYLAAQRGWELPTQQTHAAH